MFDKLGDPWPKHDCFDERYRQLKAKVLPILEAGGKPATFLPFARIAEEFGFEFASFGDVAIPVARDRASPPPPDRRSAEHIIKRMDPMPDERVSFVGVIRARGEQTSRTRILYEAVGNVGRKVLGLPPIGRAIQLTIVDADGEPNESYSCIADSNEVGRDLQVGVMAHVSLLGKVVGSSSVWVTKEIHAL